MGSTGTALQFERHECKYLLTEEQAETVRSRIEPFVELDPHARERPDHRYPIASLYLDTPDLALYRETQEGLAQRFKLRVRSYTDSDDVPIFLEIKRRIGGLVNKLRTPMHRRDLPALLGLRAVGSIPDGGKSRRAYQAFAEYQRRLGARPIVNVGYQREAYMGRADRESRVTFDRDLRGEHPFGEGLRLASPHWRSVESRGVILELKFNRRCPGWMADLVRSMGLRRRSFSKYARAVDACRRDLRWNGAGASG